MTDAIDLEAAAREFISALADSDRAAALRQVEQLLALHVDPVAVLEDVICVAQREVGRLWQTGGWTVAREHAATAISEAAVTAVALRGDGRGPDAVGAPGAPDAPAAPGRGHVVVACVDEEWHALPARVVAEVLALNGWRTTYLGASTPPAALGSYLHELVPDAVALSCSLATGLPRARWMIEALHDAAVPVLTGGPGFGADGRLALRLGADAWAPTARAAVGALQRMPPVRRDLPPLEHEGLDEHAEITVRRAELVAASFSRLESRFPPLGSYDAWQVARTREDLGHILDFLAAALFVDEPAIFHGFTAWLQDLLVTRGVADSALRVSYEAVAAALSDAPRARTLLEDSAQQLPGA